MTDRASVAVVGSGFAGSLLARILATQGHHVVLLERGAHPRFAIGESSTPLANLSLERIARRYGLADCHHLATHGRWLRHHADLRRGLKRGFTFYRHQPGRAFENRGLDSSRLVVAASPDATVADTQWFRADVDHHFVRQAVAAGVDYRDRVELTHARVTSRGARLMGRRQETPVDVRADFVIDASGPGHFLARQLRIPSALRHTAVRTSLVFGHFTDVRLLAAVVPGLPQGPFPDDWSAMHHLIDEGWMYALRFDHGVVSAGFSLTSRGFRRLAAAAGGFSARGVVDAASLWRRLLDRYPTIAAQFSEGRPTFPIAFRDRVQHRLARAAGARWAMLPHTFAFVDPLFSTGIAWGLRAVERLAECFVDGRLPSSAQLGRYNALLNAEADQIDRLVAGAYDAMADFQLFAAHALIYFATVSFAEASQRLSDDDQVAWQGFLGVGDPVLEPLPREARRRLRACVADKGAHAREDARRSFVAWVAEAIAPRNVCGFGDEWRHHLYAVDADVLVDRHALLGMTRQQLVDGLPRLRGLAPEPAAG